MGKWVDETIIKLKLNNTNSRFFINRLQRYRIVWVACSSTLEHGRPHGQEDEAMPLKYKLLYILIIFTRRRVGRPGGC